MLLEILLILFFILVFFIHKYYEKHLRMRKYYLKIFKKLGYKVYELPFKPFGAPYYESMARYATE